MGNSGPRPSHHDGKIWREYYRQQVAAGNYMRRGPMKLVMDSHGAWYRENGHSCCGCGYDQQGENGRGNPARYDMSPKVSKRDREKAAAQVQKKRWWQ